MKTVNVFGMPLRTKFITSIAALWMAAQPSVSALAQQHQPLIIAHRGASGYVPEHTAAAVVMAHAMNADFIEQDVVLSRDHVPVVLHDVKLDAVTNVASVFPERKRANGSYYAIDFSFAELQQLTVNERRHASQAGQLFPQRYQGGHPHFTIMSLAEQLSLIKHLNVSRQRNVGVYIEIKAARWHREQQYDVTQAVVKVLKQHQYLTEQPPTAIYLQSFDPEVLRRLQREFHLTMIPLIQLIAHNSWNESPVDYDAMLTAAGLESLRTYAHGVGLWIEHVLEGVDDQQQPQFSRVVENAHAAGLKVHVYTLRRDQLPAGVSSYEQLLQWLQRHGVDGLFTDFPDVRG